METLTLITLGGTPALDTQGMAVMVTAVTVATIPVTSLSLTIITIMVRTDGRWSMENVRRMAQW